MVENSKIEWCDHTFNPWIGCQKVSSACDHCYAETLSKRYGWAEWGPHAKRVRTSEANWRKPVQWAKAARDAVRRPRVFCASLADIFDNQAPDAWRSDLFALIEGTPELDWLLLTKRPQNIRDMIWPKWDAALPRNIWLGVTAENQEEYDRRLPLLPPATVHFVSYEPALGPLTIEGRLYPDWIICGGESGPNARPMHPDWARSLRDECRRTGVAFFFKQWGEWKPVDQFRDQIIDGAGRHAVVDRDGLFLIDHDIAQPPERVFTIKMNKGRSGRDLDGSIHDAMPAS